MPPVDAVLVFLRAPEPGKVKTRLAKRIGDLPALQLYKRFVTETLGTVAALGLPVRVCFYPAGEKPAVSQWLGETYPYWPQVDGHLGRKMASAFERAFSEGLERVLLVGTDLPDLPDTVFREAFRAFDRYPAVIGPSEDGGYYLIGFRAEGYLPAVFEALPWGSGEVLAKTMAIFRNHEKPVHLLPTWRDIDVYEDLIAFLQRNPDSGLADDIRTLLGTDHFEVDLFTDQTARDISKKSIR